MKTRLSQTASALSLLCMALIVPVTEIRAETPLGTSAADLNISNYQHFIIYPHLEKALKAQKSHDQATALHEFEYIHHKIPESLPLALYLAEAYRHFGQNGKARTLLKKQLKRHPEDKQLQERLAAIPPNKQPVTKAADTLTDLEIQQSECDAAPNTSCRSEIGYSALRLKRLDVAYKQLADPIFLNTPQGLMLEQDLLQRSIYLKQWTLADTLLEKRYLDKRLSLEDRRQWLQILLAGQLDERFLSLLAEGYFDDTDDLLNYASTLLERKAYPQLQRLLAHKTPVFLNEKQEQGWLYLLVSHGQDSYQALKNYQPQYPSNQEFVDAALLQEAIKRKDWHDVRSVLDRQPKERFLIARYQLSLATKNTDDILYFSKLLYAQNPQNMAQLEQYSWQLIQAKRNNRAAQLLIKYYPFSADQKNQKILILRLVELIRNGHIQLSEKQKYLLQQPLPTVALRELQIRFPWFAENCDAIRSLLSDFSPAYTADTWQRLGDCYQHKSPGLAFTHISKRFPSNLISTILGQLPIRPTKSKIFQHH